MGKHRWGVILDAGSSGTRAYVYRWPDSDHARAHASKTELKSLPKIKTKKKWTKKIRPGVSTFGPRPTAIGEEHLKELIDHALSIIPEDQVEDTPLFLMATAGMRLLPEVQQKAVKEEICRYAKGNTKFSLPDCDLHIQIISGETEGLYGWIAANYLVGGFDAPDKHQHGKGHHTYGFLDMGGASAQIAFAPNSTEAEKHANDLKLLRLRTVDGNPMEHKVFVASWLGFGVNQARQRYVDALVESIGTSHSELEIPDPCLPQGLMLSTNGTILESESESEQYLMGQGLFAECLKKTYPLLNKEAECKDDPCLINGQHVPAIDFEVNHFLGVSEYWHTTHEFFELSHNDQGYDFSQYQRRVRNFCDKDWDNIEDGIAKQKWGKKVDEKTAMEMCFKASWLINILHEGIGVPRLGIEKSNGQSGSNSTEVVKENSFLDPFQAVDKIDDTEVSWTLGKMVLYAAGQVKPAKDLPVGFGTNVPGSNSLPADWQAAGSVYLPWKGDDDDDDLDDYIEHAAKKHSSGLFIFVLLLVILGYIFRKADRRKKVATKLGSVWRKAKRTGSPRGKRRGFLNGRGLFGLGKSGGHYERVLEEGDIEEFELGGADLSDHSEDSHDSIDSHGARASGLATPKLNVVNSTDPGFFTDAPLGLHANNSHQSLHSLPNAMDRSGLVVRTESRERLHAPSLASLGSGRSKSRAGSPTRPRSGLMNAVQEL